MDINEIKKNSEAELEGNYDHLFIRVGMLGIGGGCEGEKKKD